MDSDDNNYVPRSPDLTAQYDPSYEPEPLHPQHQSYRGSVSHISPFTPTGAVDNYFGRGPPGPVDHRGGVNPAFGSYQQPAVGGMVKTDDDDEEYGGGRRSRGRGRGKKSVKQEDDDMMGLEGAGSASGSGIEVKTKFPVARIKRIMQADEDVGKVAQVTPVVVAKALELFMISLVSKAAVEAKSRSSKRVLASDLKQAVLKDEQFDFLNDIVGKVADAPAPSKGGASGGGEGDSDDGEVKKKRGGRKKKKEADDF